MTQQALEINELNDRKIQSPETGGAAPQKKRRLKMDFARFLAMPLGGQLLGTELTAGFYAQIGFRFIGASASIEPERLEIELQKFRNIFRISPESAINSCIRLGYEQYAPADDVENYLSRLHDPRHRIISELFWPHGNGSSFNLFKTEKHLVSPEVIEALEKRLRQSNGRKDGIFITHALAIAYHNLAIASELTYARGDIEWQDNYWLNALIYWKKVHDSDFFWDYLRKRVKGFDDPRLKEKDIKLVQENLPAILLAFNTFFAQAYAKAGEMAASSNHISLIMVCDLPEPVRQKTLTHARLEPLIHRIETELLNVTGKYSRKKFERVCDPVLEEASKVRDYLLKELQLPEDMVELAEFDRLCEVIAKGYDTKINYDTDDRVRDILYDILVQKKMLKLPLSPIMRRKLEQSMRNDTEILYGDFMPSSKNLDPTLCWFAEDEEADPDQSILLPIHKITHREVQVDRYQGTAGVSVKYNYRNILVPRSRYAAEQHPKYTRRKTKKSVQTTNQKAHGWARAFAFLSGFSNSGWSIVYLISQVFPGIWSTGGIWSSFFTIGLVFLLRRIILRHIDNRGEALPVGGLCTLGVVAGFVFFAFFLSGVKSIEVWQIINIVFWVLGIGSIIGFGRTAYLAFKKPEKETPSPQPKPSEAVVKKKQVKPYSKAENFPAYKSAKSAGYKDGEKPTNAEMQMTYAEEQEARRRLCGGYYY